MTIGQTKKQVQSLQKKCINHSHALVAQLDRASAFEAESRRFESCRAHHIIDSQYRCFRADSCLFLCV